MNSKTQSAQHREKSQGLRSTTQSGSDAAIERKARSGDPGNIESAVLLRPDDAVGNNGWGAALLAAGQPRPATSILSAAIQARPDYAEAHYLGIALTQIGDLERDSL